MIKPHDYSIIIKPERSNEFSDNGLIFIPEHSREPMLFGEVVAVGDELKEYDEVRVGEIVYFMAGKAVEDDDGNKIAVVSAVISLGDRKIVVTD